MADRRRRRRQNSNDSVVESEDEGVGDLDESVDNLDDKKWFGESFEETVDALVELIEAASSWKSWILYLSRESLKTS